MYRRPLRVKKAQKKIKKDKSGTKSKHFVLNSHDNMLCPSSNTLFKRAIDENTEHLIVFKSHGASIYSMAEFFYLDSRVIDHNMAIYLPEYNTKYIDNDINIPCYMPQFDGHVSDTHVCSSDFDSSICTFDVETPTESVSFGYGPNKKEPSKHTINEKDLFYGDVFTLDDNHRKKPLNYDIARHKRAPTNINNEREKAQHDSILPRYNPSSTATICDEAKTSKPDNFGSDRRNSGTKSNIPHKQKEFKSYSGKGKNSVHIHDQNEKIPENHICDIKDSICLDVHHREEKTNAQQPESHKGDEMVHKRTTNQFEHISLVVQSLAIKIVKRHGKRPHLLGFSLGCAMLLQTLLLNEMIERDLVDKIILCAPFHSLYKQFDSIWIVRLLFGHYLKELFPLNNETALGQVLDKIKKYQSGSSKKHKIKKYTNRDDFSADRHHFANILVNDTTDDDLESLNSRETEGNYSFGQICISKENNESRDHKEIQKHNTCIHEEKRSKEYYEMDDSRKYTEKSELKEHSEIDGTKEYHERNKCKEQSENNESKEHLEIDGSERYCTETCSKQSLERGSDICSKEKIENNSLKNNDFVIDYTSSANKNNGTCVSKNALSNRITLIHGTIDTVIPFSVSEKLSKKYNLPLYKFPMEHTILISSDIVWKLVERIIRDKK